MTPKVLSELLFDNQEFAALTGMVFRGITIAERGDAFVIVIRCYGKQQAPLYCMCEHDDVVEGLTGLLSALGTKSGDRMWRRDKFYRG